MRASLALLCVTLAAVALVTSAATFRVRVYVSNTRGAFVPVNSGVTAVDPTNSANIWSPETLPTATNVYNEYAALPEGTWDFKYQQSGFYDQLASITITGNTDIVLYQVPITNGLTVFMLPRGQGVFDPSAATSAQGVTLGVRLPSSAGFSEQAFSDSTLPDGVADRIWSKQQWDTENAPGSVKIGRYAMTLSPLPAGVTQVYVEVKSSTEDFVARSAVLWAHIGTNSDGRYFATSTATTSTGKAGKRLWYAFDIHTTQTSTTCRQVYHGSPPATPFYTDLSALPESTSDSSVFPGASLCYNLPSSCDIHAYRGTTTKQCGVFGDPHIVKFDGSVASCGGANSRMVIIDNSFVIITAETVNAFSAPATTTRVLSIDMAYKSPCNPVFLHWDSAASLSTTGLNSPNATAHAIRIVGQQVYIDAIHLRFMVQSDALGLQFVLSIDSDLADASAGTCKDACPGSEIAGVSSTPVSNGHADCATISNAGIRAACSYDTGFDQNWLASSTSITSNLATVGTAWTPATPYVAPPGAPVEQPQGEPGDTPIATPVATPAATPTSQVTPTTTGTPVPEQQPTGTTPSPVPVTNSPVDTSLPPPPTSAASFSSLSFSLLFFAVLCIILPFLQD